MAYKVEKLADEPILLVTFEKDFEFAQHGILTAELVAHALDRQAEPVFLINDMTEATWRFDDVVVGSSLVTRQTDLFQHPMIKENMFVTRDALVTMSTKGLDSSPFGHVKIKVFQTLADALEYVRDVEQRECLTQKKAS